MIAPAAAENVARAVLYEGYILYPYRRSSIKNQMRWNFGVLYPPEWCQAWPGSDHSAFRMQCLVNGTKETRVSLSVRFLHLMSCSDERGAWQEGLERQVESEPFSLAGGWGGEFRIPSGRLGAGCYQQELRLQISAAAECRRENLWRLNLAVENLTEYEDAERDQALLRSLASAHAVLMVEGGAFVSLTDPPSELADEARACRNEGVWPVLAGSPGQTDALLVSPIILPDYPRTAPESTGDLFDSTEIDEILTLRVLTLTEEEKSEMRASGEHARRILERAEALGSGDLMKLHGAIRDWNPFDEPMPAQEAEVNGVTLRTGDRVRLRPSRRADILDVVFKGKVAVIRSIERDFENNLHFAVVLEDDPGRDLGEMNQAGHRFFFSAAEIEPLAGREL